MKQSLKHTDASPVMTWDYVDGAGNKIGYTARFDGPAGKQVIPYFKRDAQGSFDCGIPDILKGNMPLYGQIGNDTVYVVEGEKCVDVLLQMGLNAVTSQGGANSAANSDWRPLEAVQRVFLLPDNDPAGDAYVKEVAAILRKQNHAQEIGLLALPDLPPHGDVVDWVQARIPDWDGYSQAEGIAQLADSLCDPDAGGGTITPLPSPRLHDFNIVNAVDVEPEPIDWLWPGRIAAGQLSIIAAPGGVGKSTLATSLASIVTNGGEFPFSHDSALRGDVVWITGEESAQYQLKPRAMVAGVDLTRLHFVESVMREDGDSAMRMSLDAKQLLGLKMTYPDLRLVVIDPLSAFLDARDTHNEADVRQVLTPWVECAKLAGVAVVFIAHFNKGKGHVRDKLSGSAAIRNTVRAVHVVLDDPDDDGQKLFLPDKNNLMDLEAPGLVFRVIGKDWATDRTSDVAPCIEWIGETDQKAHEVVADEGARSGRLAEAEQFLRDVLASGPLMQKDVEVEAKAAGHSGTTLGRAKRGLGVKSEKLPHGWQWSLPGAQGK